MQYTRPKWTRHSSVTLFSKPLYDHSTVENVIMDSASFKIKRFIQHCYCLVSNHATLHEAELIIKFSALHSPWSLEEKAFLQGIFSCIKIELTGTVNFPTISKPVHLGEDLCIKSQNSNHRKISSSIFMELFVRSGGGAFEISDYWNHWAFAPRSPGAQEPRSTGENKK